MSKVDNCKVGLTPKGEKGFREAVGVDYRVRPTLTFIGLLLNNQ